MTEAIGDQTSAKVQEASSAAREKASDLREQGSERLRDQLDERSTQAGSQMRSLAEALRRSGNDLRNEGKGDAARMTEPVADRLERFGGYLEQKRGDDLMRDIESFARRRPWLLAGVGLLAGVAAARFVKASSEQRYDEYRRTSGEWPSGGMTAPPVTRGSEYGYGEPSAELGPGAEGRAAGGVRETAQDDPLTRDPVSGR